MRRRKKPRKMAMRMRRNILRANLPKRLKPNANKKHLLRSKERLNQLLSNSTRKRLKRKKLKEPK